MKVSLKEYLESSSTIDEKQKLFYNMSKTLSYINNKDYYVDNFNPKEIEIHNTEKLYPIQFNHVARIPNGKSSEAIKNNIYNLSFIQISTYSNIKLEHLKPEFIKENFNMFEQLLPSDDIPYLRGVIERGATVYYYQYIDEKNKREIEKLANETGDNKLAQTGSYGFQKTKTNAAGKASVDKETKKIYGDLSDKQQAAFVTLLAFPLGLVLLAAITLIMLFIGK